MSEHVFKVRVKCG